MNTPISQASMAETYLMASKARYKLTKEASRPDLHLRQLVSHANLVDALMDELAVRRSRGKAKSVMAVAAVIEAPAIPPTLTHVELLNEPSAGADGLDEYDPESSDNYTYQAFESIQEVSEFDEADEEEQSYTSEQDSQAPQLCYSSSSSDEEDDIESHVQHRPIQPSQQPLHKTMFHESSLDIMVA